MFNFRQFFTFKYLFIPPLSKFSPLYFKLILGFTLFLLAAGTVVLIWKKVGRNQLIKVSLNKITWFFFTLGIINLFLIFARQENIRLFNLRGCWLIYFVGGIVWLVLIIRYLVVILPRQQASRLTQEKFERYLPKSKK